MKIFTRVYFSIFFICFFGTIDVAFSQSATAPIITKQPVGGTFAKNATLQLYVQSQSLDNGFQTYQWYKDGQAVVGADNSILTTLTPGAAGSYSYYCEITNTVNSTTVMVQSNTVIVKVINKEYPDHLLNGDMEHWSYPGGIQFKSNPDVIVPGVGSNRWAAAVSAGYSDATIGNGWFTTYCGYYTGNNLSPNIPVAQTKKGGVFEIQASTTGYYTGGSEAVNGEIVMELVLSGAACSYQHIATQVGKIYEWSLHHAARKDSGPLTYNRIAVVIGKSINQQTDYTGTDGSQWKDEDYPYGQNIEGGTSLTNFFQLITLKLANSIGLGSNVDAIPVGDYTVTYNSSVYYVRIIETALNSGWHQYKGVYSIPEGQGTTVFGFASITPSSGSAGNGLDNVVFASGSGLSLSPSMAYSGESSLSVTTKPGYVYGLVEVRGSSVSLLPGIDVLFSGTAAPVYSAGQEWYFPNAAGTLTFANLTPGKTYRMVGIPSGAVSVERGTNLDPGKVLDEGYYSEVCAPASNPGSDAEMGLVTGSVYLSGSVCESRLSVLNTHSDVEYALVETDGSEVIGWRLGLGVGLNSSLLFEDLSPDHDYVLVSRPYGYNEINYLSSLSSGVEVRTPACTGVKDVSPDKLTLSPDGTTLTLSESDSRAKYDVYDPQTGLFVGAMQQGNDNSGDLSFTGLTPGQTYHITMRESGVSDAIFSVGVRIYPRSADLSIDYTGETVRNETSGTFPLGIEYRLGTGTSTGWVLGDANTWRVAVDAAPLSLGIPLHNVPTPVLDSLKTLAVTSGTLHYRIQPGQDGWTGPYYSPEKTLEIPRRPSAPLRDTHYALDYRAEQLEILGSYDILYSVNSGQAWSGIRTSASPAPFYPDLNWVEVSKNIALRFPPTVNTFASDTTLQQIKGRGPEPRGVLAVINQTDVTIEQLLPETDYQYSLEVPLSWTPYTTGVGETQLPSLTYDASYDYLLRYAATDDSPASFYQMLSAPLMVLPVNFGEYAFGLTIPGLGIAVKNTDGSAQDILAMDIQDGNAASLFTLTPSLDDSNRSVPGAVSSTQLGENTNFTITPQAALPAGHYQTSVRVQYNRGGNLRWSTANVYLTVIEAQWGETLAARISGATSSSLTVTVEGVPNGASALLRLADGTPVPGIPNVANNTSSYTFTGLSPASAYTVYYHLAGDANHSPTPEKTILGWTAYAPEDAVRVDYTTEMLLMRGGYSAADYDVTINGNPVTTIPHQVSPEAETGFTVSVVRKDPSGIIPSSEPHTFNVIGREQAPGLSDITLVSASNQSTNDGSITFTGSSTGFQYRLSGYSDIMSGWSAASGSTGSILRMDSYEVRYPSTTDKFASKYRTLDMDNVPAFTITPLSVCAGGSITLSAAIGNLGADVDLHYYTGGDGSGELGSLSVTPPVTTTYFVQGVSSITGFQSNMKTLVVTVNPLPSLTLSSTNERICAGGSLDLSTLVSAYSDGTLHYYSDAGCTSALGSGMITTPGSYFVRVENTATGCKSAAQEITLTIDPLPVPGITPLRATVYTGEAISYTTDDNKNSYSWNVTNGSVTGSTATRTAGVTWGSAGTGQLTVSYTDPSTGCTGSTSLHVSVVAQGSPVITGSNSVCRGVTGEVYSTDPGKESYEWDITGDGSFTGQGTNSILVNWTSANQTGNRVSVRYKSTLGSPYTGTTNYPVEVKQAPAVGNISVPALSCEGGTLSLPAPTVTTQGSALTAQEGWLLDNQAVTLPHTLSASDHNKKLKYYATCDCSLTGYSNEVTLNVGSVPTVAAITAPNPVCAGLDLGLTAPMVTMNVAPVTQEGWMLGGQKITDPYQPAYADNNKELKYYAETAGCGTGYSNTFNITVYDKPVITGAPVSAQEVCENSLLSLPTPTVDYRGNTASQAAYWTLDGSPVDLSGYRFQSSDNNKKLCYYAQNSCSSTTSSQVTVTVNTLPQPVINPSNNLVYVGDVIPYTTDGGKNAYSWSVTNASITGNTTQSPTITWNTPGAASASVGYTDPATGCTGNTTLNVTVQTISDPPLTGPAYACKDETGLVYSTKPGQYSYDWTITGGTITSGSGTDQITVSWTSASRTGNKVSVRYQPTDISGWSPTTEYQVEVKQAPVVGNISVPALSCVGGTLSLPAPTVTAQGSALTAQEGWLLDNQPITLPHTLSASDHNKKLKYYATCDCNLTSYSNEETLNVGSAPTVGAIAAPGAVCSGTALSLSAPAVTENVAPVMQEGWMLGGQKITAPYQPAYADDTKELKYYAETAGCGTGYSTNTVNITVYDKPVITGAPTSAQQVCENSLLSLSTPTVDYRGNTASQAAYWTLNGVQIDLTSYAFQLSDNGKTLIYNAQNGCGLTTTTGVKVSVHALPVIPLNHNKSNDGTCMNTPVTFTTTSGQSGYTWNWTQGGASLTGGTTGNTLILNWNTPGPKTVEVNYTDANGCTAAAPSSTNVLINPTPVAGDFQNIILCSGSNSGTIQPTGGTDVSSYTWTGGAAAGLADNTTTLNLTSIPGFTASGVSAQIKPTVSIIPYHTNGSTTCSGSTVSFNITVNPLPLPTLSGLETAAKGQGNVVYTTESGQSNYTWSITGGTITSGGGTNSANYTATVTWDSGTNGTISVTYSSPENCPAANPAKKTVTLTDQNAAGISGTTTVCPTPGNRYTYTTQDNKFNYDWTVTGGTVTSGGDGYNTVTVEWSPSTPGSVAVSYRHENNPGLPPVDATQNITKQTVTSIATHPQGSTVCYNNTVNLSVTALSEGTPSYAWEKDGTTTVGTNSNSYIAIESGSYTVVVTGTCGSATSNVASVTVKPQPVATLSGSMTAYATQEVTYTAEAGNSGYNWNYTGATPVSGGSASDNTITVQWATTGTKTISVNYTKDGCPTTTANQDVTVNPQATPVINNPVTTVCYNTPHSYNTQAGKFKYTWTVTGGTVDSGQGTADATILWGSAGPGTIKVAYSETSSSTPVESQVTNITVNDKPSIAALIAPGGVCDNTSLTLTPPVVTSIPSATSQGWNLDGAGFTSGSMVAFAQHNKELYYEATNDCGTTQSDTVKITVYELPTVTAADQSICPGTQIDLSTAVVNLNGHALEFYVQITGGTALAGATVTPAASTTHYVTAVSSDNCTSASRVAIGITVKPVTSITVQPVAPSTVGIGNPFSLSVTAAGDNRSYQWYKDGLSILGNATATASTLTVPSTTPTDYGVYYVVVTGDCGNPVQSAGVTVDILSSDATLKDLQVNGTSLPDFDPQITEYIYTVLCDVDLADITGIPNHSSARVVNLTNQRLEPGDNVYSLTVTAENGFTQKTYTVKIVRDCYIPKITKELEDAIICIGESHTFQVLAEGHNLTYEWYYGNNRILGANSNTYTVTNAKLKDYERYYVIIRSNFNGYKASVYSKNVRLWVADNLPETLLFSDYPSPVARTGRTYHIQLAGYSDVTKYSWSYSKEGVIFSPETGGVGENETWATFGTLSEGIGTLTATLEHPCGTRQASQTIEVKYPLGNDDVTETTVRVSPNPTSGLINVSGTQANRTIRITDVTGSIKGYYQAQEGTTTLDLTAYAKGTYLLLYNGKMFKVIRK